MPNKGWIITTVLWTNKSPLLTIVQPFVFFVYEYNNTQRIPTMSYLDRLHEVFGNSSSEDGRTGVASAFKLPILNTLGLTHKRFQSLLQVHALSNPKQYTTTRLKVFDIIVSKMVKDMHEKLWCLLSSGTDEDGNKIIDFPGVDIGPSLPDTQIAQISNAFAQNIYKMMSEVYDDIVPEAITAASNAKLHRTTLPTSSNPLATVSGDIIV